MKRTTKLALLLGALLAVATHALGASRAQIVRAGNGVLKIITSMDGTGTPYVEDSSSDSLIFGNLATKYPKGLYWCCDSLIVQGPGQGYEVWTAVAFTPSAKATVTKVTVAVGYETSTKNYDVLLSLNADNKGVPGRALKTWKITFPGGKPVLGSCCVVKSKTGSVPVSANTQYWVVLSTEADSDIWAGWNLNDKDELDHILYAQYINGVWTTYSDSGPAFAVYGH